MNIYDHEDAFKAANRFAGARTKLAAALGLASDKDMARAIIADAQIKYQDLFDAFIGGVAWAREEAKAAGRSPASSTLHPTEGDK